MFRRAQISGADSFVHNRSSSSRLQSARGHEAHFMRGSAQGHGCESVVVVVVVVAVVVANTVINAVANAVVVIVVVEASVGLLCYHVIGSAVQNDRAGAAIGGGTRRVAWAIASDSNTENAPQHRLRNARRCFNALF